MKTIFWITVTSSHQKCFMKKDVLKNFTKFTGKHLCQNHFFKKVAGLSATLLKKRLALMFSYEFCKTFKNSFFTEHLRTTASIL